MFSTIGRWKLAFGFYSFGSMALRRERRKKTFCVGHFAWLFCKDVYISTRPLYEDVYM